MDSEYQDQPVARVVITTESQSSTSWFVSVIGEVGRFAGRLVKNFLRVYGLGLAFSLGLVAMVYLGLREERWWKEIFGCGILLMGGLIASFFAATKLSIVLSVSETVKVNTVGSRVMRTLFSEAFGITDENPEGNPDVTGSLHGMPVAELKERLHRAGIDLTGNRETSIRLPRLVRWLVAKTQKVLVWAAIRVVIKNATRSKTPAGNIDLLVLRSRLAEQADNLLIEHLTKGAWRLGLILALAITVAGWMVVEALRRMPG